MKAADGQAVVGGPFGSTGEQGRCSSSRPPAPSLSPRNVVREPCPRVSRERLSLLPGQLCKCRSISKAFCSTSNGQEDSLKPRNSSDLEGYQGPSSPGGYGWELGDQPNEPGPTEGATVTAKRPLSPLGFTEGAASSVQRWRAAWRLQRDASKAGSKDPG